MKVEMEKSSKIVRSYLPVSIEHCQSDEGSSALRVMSGNNNKIWTGTNATRYSVPKLSSGNSCMVQTDFQCEYDSGTSYQESVCTNRPLYTARSMETPNKLTSGRRESALHKKIRNLWAEIGVVPLCPSNGDMVEVEYTSICHSEQEGHVDQPCKGTSTTEDNVMQTRQSAFYRHQHVDSDRETYDATISESVSGGIPKLTLRKRDNGTLSPHKEMNGKKRLKLVVGNKSVVRIDLTK